MGRRGLGREEWTWRRTVADERATWWTYEGVCVCVRVCRER